MLVKGSNPEEVANSSPSLVTKISIIIARWSSWLAYQTHDLMVAGSSPALASKIKQYNVIKIKKRDIMKLFKMTTTSTVTTTTVVDIVMLEKQS